MGRAPGAATTRRIGLLLAFDIALVLLFAGIGRAEHDRGHPALGVLETAWPFLVGLAAGWALIVVVTRSAPIGLRAGVPVWLTTVVVGMLARQASGEGTAPSFVIVATLVLGALLLGWRAVRAGIAARGYSVNDE